MEQNLKDPALLKGGKQTSLIKVSTPRRGKRELIQAYEFILFIQFCGNKIYLEERMINRKHSLLKGERL